MSLICPFFLSYSEIAPFHRRRIACLQLGTQALNELRCPLNQLFATQLSFFTPHPSVGLPPLLIGDYLRGLPDPARLSIQEQRLGSPPPREFFCCRRTAQLLWSLDRSHNEMLQHAATRRTLHSVSKFRDMYVANNDAPALDRPSLAYCKVSASSRQGFAM